MIAWAAIIPAVMKGLKVAGAVKGGIDAINSSKPTATIGQQENHEQIPQRIQTVTRQDVPQMQPLMPPVPEQEAMQPMSLTPEYNWSETLGNAMGKIKGFAKEHPLLTAGIGAGAMGLISRGAPEAMLAGGLVANKLARRNRPVIGG